MRPVPPERDFSFSLYLLLAQSCTIQIIGKKQISMGLGGGALIDGRLMEVLEFITQGSHSLEKSLNFRGSP